MMTKHYRELTGDDPKLLEYLEKHKTLTYPENLRIVARGEEDTKDGKAYRFKKYGLNFFIASTIKEEGTEGDPVYTTVFLSRSPDLEDMKKYAENNTTALAKAYPCFDEVQHFDDDEDIEQNRVETLVYSRLDPPYCVTNDYGYNGAGVLYCDDVLEKLWEKIGDYFILAFSTRDVFVYPARDYDMDEYLLEMADQIEQWKKEEKEKGTFLTDRIFFYNGLGLKEYKG